MSPEAGTVLLEQIAPRLKTIVPVYQNEWVARTIEELLYQDGLWHSLPKCFTT